MKKYIGILGGTGRVGQVCAHYLQKNVEAPLLLGARTPPTVQTEAFCAVDVFDHASLEAFCQQCFLIINCSGPATLIEDRIAQAALRNACHFVDAGGYSPLQQQFSHQQLCEKDLTFVLGLGILPGLSEIFPTYLCLKAQETMAHVESIACYAIGRDSWTYTSAWDIAWGIGHIGQSEGPIYYEQGKRKEVPVLLSGKKALLPPPVGKQQFFRLMRQDFQKFIEDARITNAHAYGNNWGFGVCAATLIIRMLSLYNTPEKLDKAAKLIMRASQWDMRNKKPGFMLHAEMTESHEHKKTSSQNTLYFEDTYKATGLCAAIGAQLITENMACGLYAPAQLPQQQRFMELFLAQGYTIQRTSN